MILGAEILYKLAEQRLSRIIKTDQVGLLRKGRIGLEKETLRVGVDGKIAQTPHPVVLGSALAHPYITTDYSEALLEFITPPFEGLQESLRFLRDTQQYVYAKLDDELLWATSMPCVVDGETSIPIAVYGSSNIGVMKTVYRRGLGHRYGKTMQVIAGAHFNYSLPEIFWSIYKDHENSQDSLQDFIADHYFAMIRNLLRFGWLISYLFGASPAVCKSFLCGEKTTLEDFDSSTFYGPYATSLRMGDIGYQNKKEAGASIRANYNSLDEYVASLTHAVETVYPDYEKIGIIVNGEYQQLNANILQIENEYYSTVRPKQIVINNEKPALALKRRGVQYVELRSLDVNAFEPMGVSEEQLYFLEAFMLFCLFHESPPIDEQERTEIDQNEIIVAHHGRDPALNLQRNGNKQSLKRWAIEIFDAMQGFCEVLDEGETDQLCSKALNSQKEAAQDPERTPSARILAEMRKNGEGFFHFAMRMSELHKGYFSSLPRDEEMMQKIEQLAVESIHKQKAIEEADDTSFDEYLQWYFAQS